MEPMIRPEASSHGVGRPGAIIPAAYASAAAARRKVRIVRQSERGNTAAAAGAAPNATNQAAVLKSARAGRTRKSGGIGYSTCDVHSLNIGGDQRMHIAPLDLLNLCFVCRGRAQNLKNIIHGWPTDGIGTRAKNPNSNPLEGRDRSRRRRMRRAMAAS